MHTNKPLGSTRPTRPTYHQAASTTYLPDGKSVEDVARWNLLSQRPTFSRIRECAFVPQRFAGLWYSQFSPGPLPIGSLWKVDVERRTLHPDEIESGNVFCLFIDPDTNACAPFFTM